MHETPARLDGDDLFQWGVLIARLQAAQDELDRFGRILRARRGFRPGAISITNEGYLLPNVSSPTEQRLREMIEASSDGTDT